jgi:ABC-type multidrug transport system ATPase subunit
MDAVVVENVVMTYADGTVRAVEDVSFSVQRGELFGLIGPDGAGKTSLFRMLATLLLASSGRATIDGFDVVADYRHIRTILGYMPGRFSLYQDLTVEEILTFFATLFGTSIEENRELIHDIYVQLEPFRTRRAGKLSGGMKQKLALCCALIHRPSVLLLDEPTTGVDPVSRKEFWTMLGRLRDRGITILVSTPYMDEAVLCDRIALMQGGRLLNVDTPRAIVDAFDVPLYGVRADDMYALRADLAADPRVTSCHSFGRAFHCTIADGTDVETSFTDELRQRGHTDVAVQRIKPTIEDCFIRLMGH